MPPKKKMPINQSAYIIQNPMAVSADNMKLIMARSAAMRLGHGPTSIAVPSVIASLRDRDTETCRAIPAGYGFQVLFTQTGERSNQVESPLLITHGMTVHVSDE